jgi:hypothetical protein
MNKKAFLLGEETLKIIIAVIAISFLIYFLVTLYYSNVNDKKVKQAEETLLRTEEIINGIFNEEVIEQDLVNPSGWYLFGFTADSKPNSCGGKNCLCICDNAWDTKEGKFQRQEQKCDEKGFCLKVDNLVSGDFKINIKGDKITFISVHKIENEVVINEL